MKLGTLAIILIVWFSLLGIFANVAVDYTLPKKVMTLEYNLTAAPPKEMGFSVDVDKIHFGKVCQNCISTRNFGIINPYEYKVRIEFLVGSHQGAETINWFRFDPPTNTLIEARGNRIIGASVKVPKNASTGRYDGIVIVNMYRAKPWDKEPVVRTNKWRKGCFSDDLWNILQCKL